ncbi:unnamed protein product [Caenorhabditis angaria]|uniref:Ig-like domain-containing protein n=1 Tax=Caenorhabditis angaria TaxID=860376 RepID=A0A9P1IE61_9PELO|nr:unnamed protein product [Caenorhabditis angaria]
MDENSKIRFQCSFAQNSTIPWILAGNLRFMLLLLLKSLLILCSWVTVAATTNLTPKKPPTDRLVPIGATTAFMCDPIFHQITNATWFKNGVEIGVVDAQRNLILRKSVENLEKLGKMDEDPMPKIGFLVINNVTRDDEGIYYCQSHVASKFGEVYRLKIAYVHPIPDNRKVHLIPTKPILGRPISAHCPLPEAFPLPKITWTINSLPISHISSDFQIFPENATLQIGHFSWHHFGLLECHVANFAGKTKAGVFIDSQEVLDSPKSLISIGCSAAFRSSIFMFLLGCLVTSSIVLIYLGLAVFFIKPGRSRRVLRPTFWSRTDPTLGPGFRKAVVPLPDCFSTNSNSTRLLA